MDNEKNTTQSTGGIRQKLTSRKLWAAIVAAVVAIGTALFSDSITPEAVELLSKAVVALCCYIFGEGIVDAARNFNSNSDVLYGILLDDEEDNEE